MDRKELDLIQELMDKLTDEMEYGEEDFEERLGRKKPDVKVVKIEGVLPEDGESEESDEDEEGPMDEMYDSEMDEESHSPEDSLKKRLMKLRG